MQGGKTIIQWLINADASGKPAAQELTGDYAPLHFYRQWVIPSHAAQAAVLLFQSTAQTSSLTNRPARVPRPEVAAEDSAPELPTEPSLPASIQGIADRSDQTRLPETEFLPRCLRASRKGPPC
jgi:hypothetical protein